jgi:TPR repeat protein
MEGNNSWAYGKMALMYEEGTGMEKDPRKAFELMSKSAELGSAAGIFYLGKYYELGFGTEADHQAALRYFRKAKAGGLEAAGKLLDRLSAEEFKTHYSSPRETFLQIWKEVEEETIK